MQQTDSLHELVHCLSKSERRHFKLGSGGSGEGEPRKYMQLYALLINMKVFDPEKLTVGMGWKVFSEKYPMAKKYLEAKILKSLADYSEKGTTSERLKVMLREIEVLYNKELDQQAVQKVRKAKRLAYRAEAFIVLLKILRIERRLLVKSKQAVFSKAGLVALNEEFHFVIAGIRLREDVYHLHDQFFSVHNSPLLEDQGQKEPRTDVIFRELLALNAPAQPYFFSRAMHHNVLNQYHYQKGEFAASLREVECIVDLFNHQPEMKKELTTTYLSALHNKANRGLVAQNYAKTYEAMLELQGFSCRISRHEQQRRSSAVLVGFSLMINSGQVQENPQFINYVQREYITENLGFSHRFQLNLKLLLVNAHFIEQAYSSALYFLNDILQDKTHASIRIYKRMVPILELLVHYEMGAFDLLEYRIRNLLEKAKDADAYQFELTLLRYLAQMIKGTDKSLAVRRFFASLEALKEVKLETAAITMFDFESWAEANAAGCTFQDKLRENWAQKGAFEVSLDTIFSSGFS